MPSAPTPPSAAASASTASRLLAVILAEALATEDGPASSSLRRLNPYNLLTSLVARGGQTLRDYHDDLLRRASGSGPESSAFDGDHTELLSAATSLGLLAHSGPGLFRFAASLPPSATVPAAQVSPSPRSLLPASGNVHRSPTPTSSSSPNASALLTSQVTLTCPHSSLRRPSCRRCRSPCGPSSPSSSTTSRP